MLVVAIFCSGTRKTGAKIAGASFDTALVQTFWVSELESDLANKGFLRVHRSFLVNLSHVAAYSAVELDIGPHPIPIGANYRESVMNRLHN